MSKLYFQENHHTILVFNYVTGDDDGVTRLSIYLHEILTEPVRLSRT